MMLRSVQVLGGPGHSDKALLFAGQGKGAPGDYQKYMSDYQKYMKGQGGSQGDYQKHLGPCGAASF